MKEEELKEYRKGLARNVLLYLYFGIKTYRNSSYCQVDVSNCEYMRLISLIDIYELDVSEYEKAYQINNLFKTSDELLEVLFKISEYKDDKYLGKYMDKWKEIYNFYGICEDNNVIEQIKDVLDNEKYHYSYNYAKFIIESYIKNDDSYKIYQFLDDNGIDMNIFNYCIEVVGELDVSLYNKFNIKHNDDILKLDELNKKAINEIVKGIKTGYLSSDKEFNIIQFLKLVPFKEDKKFISKLDVYLRSYDKEARELIFTYLNKNNLLGNDYMQPVSASELSRIKTWRKGHLVTEEDNERVIEYMQENNFPMLKKFYNVVRNEYLDSNITCNIPNKEKIIKKVLIP